MEKNRREKYIVKLPCASPIKTHGPRGLSATNSGLSVQIITLCQNETQFQMPQKQLKLPILGAFDCWDIISAKMFRLAGNYYIHGRRSMDRD